MSRYKIEGLENELCSLCEIRGELDDHDNAMVERRIAEIKQELEVLSGEAV